MSAGQRNVFLNRDDNESLKKANENFNVAGLDNEDNLERDFDAPGMRLNGLSFPPELFDDLEQTSTISSTKKRKVKNHRRKVTTDKQLSLLESKLNNLALMRQGLIVKSELD